jgi:hypothetical protein
MESLRKRLNMRVAHLTNKQATNFLISSMPAKFSDRLSFEQSLWQQGLVHVAGVDGLVGFKSKFAFLQTES